MLCTCRVCCHLQLHVTPNPDALSCAQVLDEPAPQQSDPALLTLQLRQLSRQAAGDANEVVGKLAHGEAGLAKRLDAWIASTAQVGCMLACLYWWAGKACCARC